MLISRQLHKRARGCRPALLVLVLLATDPITSRHFISSRSCLPAMIPICPSRASPNHATLRTGDLRSWNARLGLCRGKDAGVAGPGAGGRGGVGPGAGGGGTGGAIPRQSVKYSPTYVRNKNSQRVRDNHNQKLSITKTIRIGHGKGLYPYTYISQYTLSSSRRRCSGILIMRILWRGLAHVGN